MPQQWYCPSYNTTSTATTLYYPNTYYQTNSPYYTGNAAVSPNATWQYWVNNSTITTTPYTDQIWQTWVTSPNATYGSYAQAQAQIYTPEEMEARRAEREAEQRERVAARARARILLEEFLDQEQKVELEKKGQFHVTGSRGRRYCIRTSGQSGNVDLLTDRGEIQARLCCHPRGYLPEGDAWLMQMIEIRHDEDHFLRTANVHRGSLPVARY